MSWATATAARFRPPPPPPTAVELMQRAGLQPDPWQTEFLTERPMRALLNCSRQSGKSTCTAAAVLEQAIIKPGALILLVSNAQRQAIELLGKVRQFVFAQQPAVPLERISEMSLRLKNGSRIISLPGKDESIRGFSAVDLIVVDEAAYVPGTLANAVRPMLAVSNGRMYAMSTPRGKRGWWYEAWVSGSQQWTRIQVTADQCPRISAEFLEEERASKTHAQFMTEYFCSFEDAEGAVFSAQLIDDALDDDVEPLFPEGWQR
jgi:hypothetical protein